MEENNEQIPVEKRFNNYALASFILSLVGLLVAGIPCGIAAFVTGILGLVKFNPENEKNNKWMAIIGIIVGVIDIILVIVMLPSLYKKMGIM